MIDFRISVEELEKEFEAMELARNIVRDAYEQIQCFENVQQPTLLILNEDNVPDILKKEII